VAHQQLKRELRFWDSIAISIGIIIGVGIFRVPSEVAKHLSSPSLILFAWVLGGVIAYFGALCYAELASRFPHTGGTYVFLREAYGRLVGFLFGWTEIAILRAGSIAAVAYVFSTYLKNFIPLDAWGERIAAIATIAVLTFININGLRQGTKLQNVLSSLKGFNLLLMALVIFWFGTKTIHPLFSWNIFSDNQSQPGSNFFLMLAPALVPILWTYGGWHECAFMSGEFKDTKRELPISMVISTLIVMILYLLINVAYLQVLTPREMTQEKAIASVCFMRLFGPAGSTVVTAAVLISAFGALNSTIMTGGRIPFAVAKDYPKFGWFAHVDSKFGTPKRALLLNSIWAAVLILFGNFETLLFFCQFAQWLFFALAGASLIWARKNSLHEGFETPLHPLFPILFVALGAAICVSIIWNFPHASLTGIALIAIGIPIYLWLKYSESAR